MKLSRVESGEISTVRLNLLRVPSFLAVNAATSSTGGTCGLPATARNGTDSPKPTPCPFPSPPPILHSFSLEQAASYSFSSGTQQRQPLTLIWVAARVTFTPLPTPFPSPLHSLLHPLFLCPPPLEKKQPIYLLKVLPAFCSHLYFGRLLFGSQMWHSSGSALSCPPPARFALPWPLCVCSCATCQTFVAAVTSLRERQHRGRRLRLISSLQRAAVSLSLILLHHAVSVSMQLSSLRPHSKQTATPILPTPTFHLLLHISPGSSVYLRCCLLQNLSYAISAFFKYSMA